MRVLVLILALMATPFVTGVAQAGRESDNPGLAKALGRLNCKKLKDTDKQSKIQGPKLTKEEKDALKDCNTEPPSPPPPTGGCVVTSAKGGTAKIDGNMFDWASPWPALADWCVQLTGTVNATAKTDADGNFAFTNLPAGTYTICETLQTGWVQAYPLGGSTCSGNTLGYTFAVSDGAVSGGLFFANSRTP